MAAISGATTKELMQFAGHGDIHVTLRYQEAVNSRKREPAKTHDRVGEHLPTEATT